MGKSLGRGEEIMGNCDIKVSICCLTYNHEKYIRQALDSFLMQKTNFKYEILIHDDASTDGTADIIREYEKKYPEIIKPIYQKENQYSQRVKISWLYQYPRAKGKYIALCEGDDFWCDENKLQLQYNLLEKNQAVLCTHKVRYITECGEKMNKTLPEIETASSMSGEEFLHDLLTKDSYPFHTSSYMFRKESILDECNDVPQFIKIAPVGDVFLMILLASKGDRCYINREMSCYRTFSVSSWSTSYVKNKNFRIVQNERRCNALEAYDIYTDYKYHEFVSVAINRRKFLLLESKEEYAEMLEPLYKEFFRELPLKMQIYILCRAKVPWIVRMYRVFKRKVLKK